MINYQTKLNQPITHKLSIALLVDQNHFVMPSGGSMHDVWYQKTTTNHNTAPLCSYKYMFYTNKGREENVY